MGRLKIKITIIFAFILFLFNCDSALQTYIVDDLFGPPYRNEVAKLLPSNGSVTEGFGFAVDIDGDYAIVGAPAADGNRGAAYIFERQSDGTWNDGQRIVASDRIVDDSFGEAVAISGEWVVVGVSDKTSGGFANGGEIFIYQRDGAGTWTETQNLNIENLIPTSLDTDDQLGTSVAIDGSWMAVGAASDDKGLSDSNAYGATYILKLIGSTWNFDKRLDEGTLNSSFGSDVDILGDILVVGSARDDNKKGAAYLYRFVVDGWELSEKVTASVPTLMALMGYSVSLSTDFLITGAVGEGIAGTASFFTRSGSDDWNTVTPQLITSETPKDGDAYGIGLATDGSYILAGAPFADYYSPLSGAVYLYEIGEDGTVTFKETVAPDDTTGLKSWGISIAIDNGMAIIGSNEDPFSGGDGAAYIFK